MSLPAGSQQALLEESSDPVSKPFSQNLLLAEHRAGSWAGTAPSGLLRVLRSKPGASGTLAGLGRAPAVLCRAGV